MPGSSFQTRISAEGWECYRRKECGRLVRFYLVYGIPVLHGRTCLHGLVQRRMRDAGRSEAPRRAGGASELNANVLSTGKPSDYSTQILERSAPSERFKSDPQTVLAALNSGLGKPDERDRLFALSELSFAYAEESGNQSYYLGSAAYAYAFLFPPRSADAPGAYDPRLRLAVDLYNRGIALGLATKDGKEVDLSARQLSLSFGSLDLGVNPEGFTYGGNHLTKFVSLTDLKVRGLRNTYRRAGIGAALSARVEPSPNSPASRWIPPSAKVPIDRVLCVSTILAAR